MINRILKEGLKMMGKESVNKSLNCSQVRKYLDKENEGKWIIFMDLEREKGGGELVLYGNVSERKHLKDKLKTT